jgi:ABC-type nitrate/sulfonate/bicarbonate transport system substrate-binding protein
LRVSRDAFVRHAAIAAGVIASALPAWAQTADTATMKIGTPGQAGNAGVYFAQDMGYFRRVGLDAVITTLSKGSGAAVVAAVTGGTLDCGEADLVSIAAARQHGIKISLLAPSAYWIDSQPTQGIIVAKASPIHTARDFNGKTIGVPSLEGISRISTNAWLEQNGGDPATVKFVEIPSASAAQTVARGTIDAYVLTEPTLSASLTDCRIVAAPLNIVGKAYVETAWFGSDDWIAKNPQLAVKFALAMRDAQRWANANPALAAGIFEKYSGVTAESLKNTVHTRYGDVLDPAHVQPVLDMAYKYHAIPQPLLAKDLISSAVTTLPR